MRTSRHRFLTRQAMIRCVTVRHNQTKRLLPLQAYNLTWTLVVATAGTNDMVLQFSPVRNVSSEAQKRLPLIPHESLAVGRTNIFVKNLKLTSRSVDFLPFYYFIMLYRGCLRIRGQVRTSIL